MNSKKQAKNKNNTVKTQLLCILLFLLALAGFHLLTVIDNKYSKDYYEIRDGVLLADAQALNHDKLLYLTEGWEIYPDRLLSPQDFLSSSVPKRSCNAYWRIYEFCGLPSGHSPYGTATYRLRFASSRQLDGLVLYLPEIFSACRVYINGKEAVSQGSLQPYSPMVRDLILSVPDGTAADIIIQTANYSHYYSGIIYPPVLGSAQAIHLQTSVRMVFYSLLCFFSLSIALLSAAVWLGSRKQPGRRSISGSVSWP